jgi:hypothetical protein
VGQLLEQQRLFLLLVLADPHLGRWEAGQEGQAVRASGRSAQAVLRMIACCVTCSLL